jgi:hypothetical protein
MSRPRLLPVLLTAWLLVVLISFHRVVEPFPADQLLSLLGSVALLGIVTLSAWGLGAIVLSPLSVDAMLEGRPEAGPLRLALAIGAGLGAMALAMFGLAAAGLLYRPAGIGLVAAGLAALALGRPLRVIRRQKETAASQDRWSAWEWALLGLLVLAGIATLGPALAPPEFYDSLIYHLAVPQQYVLQHRMVPIEGNYYAHFPANMGMLYALGLLLRDGSFAQSLHWLCGALSVLALYGVGRRHLPRSEALLACALFALVPGVMLVSTYAIADLAITLFGTLGLAAVLEWWDSGDRRWLAAAGIATGLAMGTKYTAAAVVLLPLAAAVAARPRTTWKGRILGAAILAVTAVLVLSPWLARNLVFTGNPAAPYFQHGSGTPELSDEIQRRLPKEAGAAQLAWHVLKGPWNASMRRLGAGGYLGPLFLVLLPALPFVGRLPRIAAPAAIVAGAGVMCWAATTQVTRYLMPVLPAAALLAAMAARRLPRPLAAAAVGWPVLYGLYLYAFLIVTIGSWGAVTGAEPAEEYLARRVSYYPAARFLDSLPSEAKVLLVGEGRGFYLPRSFRASTPFDPPALERYANGAADERSLLERLKHEGFTHLLVSGPELKRIRGMEADAIMKQYFPSGSPRLLFERNDVRVYELPG